MTRTLIAVALILVASVASADHGRGKYVDPSRGSSWTWRPNNPVVVVLPPVRGPGVVRPTLPPPSVFVPYTPTYNGGYSYGGYGSVYKYGSGPAAQKVIIVNPYCQ